MMQETGNSSYYCGDLVAEGVDARLKNGKFSTIGENFHAGFDSLPKSYEQLVFACSGAVRLLFIVIVCFGGGIGSQKNEQ